MQELLEVPSSHRRSPELLGRVVRHLAVPILFGLLLAGCSKGEAEPATTLPSPGMAETSREGPPLALFYKVAGSKMFAVGGVLSKESVVEPLCGVPLSTFGRTTQLRALIKDEDRVQIGYVFPDATATGKWLSTEVKDCPPETITRPTFDDVGVNLANLEEVQDEAQALRAKVEGLEGKPKDQVKAVIEPACGLPPETNDYDPWTDPYAFRRYLYRSYFDVVRLAHATELPPDYIGTYDAGLQVICSQIRGGAE